MLKNSPHRAENGSDGMQHNEENARTPEMFQSAHVALQTVNLNVQQVPQAAHARQRQAQKRTHPRVK